MVDKRYEWLEGAKLEEHSRRKHKILREYVFDYLTVRCKLPQQGRFILHDNASLQAHFGRSGLDMLSYDPRDEGMLYLFDDNGRAAARDQLLEDIPRLVVESGDARRIMDFYENIYNITPAHADDVRAAIIENPDLEVITPAGDERRKANTIDVNDIIKVKIQRSFFPMFLNAGVRRGS